MAYKLDKDLKQYFKDMKKTTKISRLFRLPRIGYRCYIKRQGQKDKIYIQFVARISDNIELYFSINEDNVLTATFKNKQELLDKTILNKKSIIYPFRDELLSNDDIVSLEDYFCVVDDNYTQEIKVIHGKYLLSAHEVLFYGTEKECRKYIDEM